MAKRLSISDVQTIFDCVCQNKTPPSSLEFCVILVSGGLKISPPSWEFENGTYVLLWLQNESMYERHTGRIPSKLEHLVLREKTEKVCYWRLSGPQIPMPTKIQQRYCYPKGNAEYSTSRGAMLWTLLNDYSKENIECRILHVYSSKKLLSAQKDDKKENDEKVEVPVNVSRTKSDKLIDPKLMLIPFSKMGNKNATFRNSNCESFQHRHSFATGRFWSQPLGNVPDKQIASDDFSFKHHQNIGHLTNNNDANSAKQREIQVLQENNDSDASNGMLRPESSDVSFWTEPVLISTNNALDLECRLKTFSKWLYMLQSELKAIIKELPPLEQGYCLALMVSWAKNISKDPDSAGILDEKKDDV